MLDSKNAWDAVIKNYLNDYQNDNLFRELYGQLDDVVRELKSAQEEMIDLAKSIKKLAQETINRPWAVNELGILQSRGPSMDRLALRYKLAQRAYRKMIEIIKKSPWPKLVESTNLDCNNCFTIKFDNQPCPTCNAPADFVPLS